ncbi:MAG TPA: hydantoinase/oxoprolinase family protein [Acidimicrobiales bacterium]
MSELAPGGGKVACIGVDIGGTFTDAVLTDGNTTWRAKAPTTPDEVGAGVLVACRLVADRAGLTLESLLPRVERFGLGTTAVTNVLAARVGRRVGLITTKGFEDLVPLARGRRVNEDGWLMMPPQVVERSCIVGVDERIDRRGAVLRHLDPAEVVSAARSLLDQHHVEALAVSLLWSFRNPVHEEQALGALADAFPDLPVMSGAALHPVIREFERSTFALLNAYTSGALVGVDRLAADLSGLGLRVPVLLVHSGGGSITTEEARRVPINLAESGPAAGVAAAVAVAGASGVTDAVTCDMGGTSFDVSVVSGGQPTRRNRGELMGIWTALSLVDVDSIGAGGGSLGWVDARGMLRVGPHSAGAVPGPACYGRGGTEPAITDALLVLGYLAPDRFLGGEMGLDATAAVEACQRLGAPIDLDPREVAWGMREVALAGMAKAVRGRLSERGLDPRQHALISYGGCGGLFAADIARAIGATRVVVPELASVLSAFGTATADVRRERVQSLEAPFPVDTDAVAAVADKLRAEVDADVAADGIAAVDRSVLFEVDLRFKRQKWELSVPLVGERVDEAALTRLLADFRSDYARRYGEGALMAGAVIELVGLRAIGVGRTVKAGLQEAVESIESGPLVTAEGDRAVGVTRGAEPIPVAVHHGPDLHPGHRLAGPALVDGVDTTVWVPAGAELRVDQHRSLILEVA